MRKILMIFCMVCLFVCTAGAEEITLPSTDCVSPGLAGWLRQEFSENTLSVRATGAVEELFFIRDLTVLQNILSLIQVDALSGTTDGKEVTRVRVRAGDDLLSECIYAFGNGELLFEVDGKRYSISENEMGIVSGTEQFYNCLESFRQLFLNDAFPPALDLKKVNANIRAGEFFKQIEGLNVGEISVSETRTESLNLVGLQLNGIFYWQGEPWTVSGTISGKEGKDFADKAEVKIEKDSENLLNITLTSKNAVEKKGRQQGIVTGNGKISVTGKIDGYAVRAGINQKVKNEWKLEGDTLTEKVGLTITFSWQDKNPDLKYRHLNTGSVVWKNRFSLETNERVNVYHELHDDLSIELKMNDENVMIASADIQFKKGDEKLSIPYNGERVTREESETIIASVMEKISRKLYSIMDSRSRNKVNQGL